ncbi:MAG: phytanoyl-CoA dioxygenase family protein [Pseudomonadota bacterium]
MTLTQPSAATGPADAPMPPVDLNHVTVTGDISVDDIAARVHRDGIVILPEFITGPLLEQLNKEFDQIMAAPDNCAFQVDRKTGLVNVRTSIEIMQRAGMANTAALFSNAMMAEIAYAYYGTRDAKVNHQLFINLNEHSPTPHMEPPFALHFDKREVFKFFIYLTDTTAENGAMRVAPGTVEANRALRQNAMASGVPLQQINNVIDEQAVPSLPIEGPAGTMFIFTTDVAHGAGAVAPGQSRRIMRGHCHSQAMLQAMGQA